MPKSEILPSMMTQEKRFDVLIRKTGEVIFLIEARDLPPSLDAKLAYNPKGKIALLARDEHEDILLPQIHSKIFQTLKKRKRVSILEVNPEGETLFQYESECFIDPELTH